MTNQQIIQLIRFAIEVAGDGGIQPFDDEEYTAMYDFLDKIEKREDI